MLKATQSKIYVGFGGCFLDLFVPTWPKARSLPAAALGSFPAPCAPGPGGPTAFIPASSLALNACISAPTTKALEKRKLFSLEHLL